MVLGSPRLGVGRSGPSEAPPPSAPPSNSAPGPWPRANSRKQTRRIYQAERICISGYVAFFPFCEIDYECSLLMSSNLEPLDEGEGEVLYLYDNIIPVVENLSLLKNLTHLYLQNNHIRELDGLSGLKSLQKLYLQGNQIQIVSGLRSVPALEELHLNGQRFPPGDMGGLTFDMNQLHDMASLDDGIREIPSLMVLDLRGNPMTKIPK
eukprot:gene3924-13998_t